MPYEKKELMKEKLIDFLGEQKDFIGYDLSIKSLGDVKIEGIYHRGPVGIVYNSDLDFEPWRGSQRELPIPFSSIEVFLGQTFDFNYYVIYICNIKEEYQKRGIKETYIPINDFVYDKETKISSRRGPELEPNIREYQTMIQTYLKDYSCGIFLEENDQIQNCPNIKILSMKNIDFENFKEWEREHRLLLMFLGYQYTYSQFNDSYLVGFSADELFQKKGYESGLIFMGSEEGFNYERYGDLESGIIHKIKYLVRDFKFQSYLFSYFWMSYQLHININEWDQKINDVLSDLKSKKGLDDIMTIHKNMIDERVIFDSYYNDEISNNRKMERNTEIFNISNRISPLSTNSREINVFETLTFGCKNNINQEKYSLEDINKHFESFFSYSNNLTNIRINKNNINTQRIAIIIAIISLLISTGGIYLSIKSINIAISDYTKTHPEGNYIVSIHKLGYDEPLKMDKYRIQITYYGSGESKYLSLRVGIVGVNPTVLSKGNCEVMEPNIILIRNYVDGLIGWVDYGIYRSASFKTKLNIIEANSDVNVIIKKIN